MEERVKYVIEEVFGTSQRHLTKWANVSPGTTNHWVKMKPSVDLARLLGVSYDYLIGDSDDLWSGRVKSLRKAIGTYLAETSADSPSQRFVVVARWLQSQAPDLVTDEFLATFCRLSVETLREYLEGKAMAGDEAIHHLATFTNVPYAWFVDGNAKHVKESRVAALAQRMIDMGVSEDEIEAFLDAYTMKHGM